MGTLLLFLYMSKTYGLGTPLSFLEGFGFFCAVVISMIWDTISASRICGMIERMLEEL